jgi:VanZ family protein
MAFIFAMSSRAGSTENSSALIGGILKRLTPTFYATLTAYQLDCLDYGFRKACHFTGYAILSALALRSVARGRTPQPRHFVVAFALSVAYAVTDEIHQSFVPLRTASLGDVGIDALGAASCLAVARAIQSLGCLDRRIGAALRGYSGDGSGGENT